jgi:glycerophosphoryl diester phosphodiesterase
LTPYEQIPHISFKKRALRPLKKRWPHADRILLSRYIPRGFFYEGIGFNKRLSLFTGLYGKLGKAVGLWTLNSQENLEKAISKDVDFLITDEYQQCFELVELAKRKL